MCKNPLSPYIIGMSKTERKAVVFKSDCDSWECEECQVKKRSQWIARAVLGLMKITSQSQASTFVTITTAEWYGEPAAAIAAFPRAWNKLYSRLKRRNPDFAFLMTIEFGKKTNHMHAHFLTNATQNERWYKDNARSCGLGYQAKVEPVESDGKAAAYVSKYIGKSLGGQPLPSHFRRVRCSQNWAALEVLEDAGQAALYDWLVCNTTTSLWAATEECQLKNFTMIDGETGEYFDYQDACETWYHA